MTYVMPEQLTPLSNWLVAQGVDVGSIKTDRQAAFMAQQLLGSRVRFPERGQSMFPALLKIQECLNQVSRPKAQPPRVPRLKLQQVKSKKKAAKHRERHANLTDGVHVYCDGAAVPNPGTGGWGVVAYRDGVEVGSLSGGDVEATNNQMELTGLLNAIEWVIRANGTIWQNEAVPAVTIWCDSQYAVKGVNEWRHGWKAKGWKRGGKDAALHNRILQNADLWQAIDEALSKTASVTVRWVKGHAGIAGNDRADALAEEGRRAIDVVSSPADHLTSEYRAIMNGGAIA